MGLPRVAGLGSAGEKGRDHKAKGRGRAKLKKKKRKKEIMK